MKLGQVLTYKKGKSPTRSIESNAEVLYLTPEYLRGKTDPTYVQDFSQKVNVLDGDLLLLWDGSNAGEFFKGKNGILASTMVLLNCEDEKIDREYLFYKLKGYEDYLKGQTNGSGIPHVDKEILQKLEIGEFDQVEQKRIADVLNKIDVTIENTNKLINKYSRIKTGMMQNLLTCGIDKNGNIRSKKTHRFVVKEGIEVPEEWEVKTLRKITERIGDGIHSTPKYVESSDYSFINGNNLENGKIIITRRTNCVGESEYKKYWVELNNKTILYSINGTIGNIALYNGEKVILGKSACYIQCNHETNRDYLYRQLQSPLLMHYFENELTGSTIKNLSLKSIRNAPIPCPDPDEQKMISEKIDIMDKQIENEECTLNKLLSIKTGLMQDLLSGKVRVIN